MDSALEDGGSVAVALGGGDGSWHWEVALGGGWRCSSSVGQCQRQKNMRWWHRHQRRQSLGLIITMLASVLAKMAREDASNARNIHWKPWQGNKCIAAAVAVAAVWIQQKHWWGKGKGAMAPDQDRWGEVNATMVSPQRLQGRGKTTRQGRPSAINAVWAKGVQRRHSAKIKLKKMHYA